MPKLSPLHWLLAAIFLAFYGFAVFAVTRDYYVRHPVRAAVASPDAAALPAGHPTSAPAAPTAAVAAAPTPAAITETNPERLRERADTLFTANRYREAIPVYRRILELVPADLESQNDLGLALYYTGNVAEAQEVLRAGPAADPKFQRGWLSLGFVTLQRGDKSQARQALQRALDLGADNPIGQEAARLMGVAKD